jgi:hypothetical protein
MAAFTAGEVLTAANLNAAINGPTVNAQTANYTLALTDAGKLVTMSVGSACTLTVPPNSSVAFAVGAAIAVVQKGAGQVTITAGSGVTINSFGGALKVAGQYAGVELYKEATDTWYAIGNVTT